MALSLAAERSRKYRAEHPERTDAAVMKYRYGITAEEYAELLLAQRGVCAICGRENSGSKDKRRLCVDHDHETGIVRGLLCHPCNRGLGQFGDDIERLRAAVEYME